MHTDELRREVAGLADGIEPFAGDVDALHRRLRRIRVVTGTIGVSLIVVAAILATTVVRGHDRTRVRISGAPDKEVALTQMTHVDAIVVPATPAVKQLLDASPATRFAFVPRGSLTTKTDNLAAAAIPMCFLKSSAGYAVAVDNATPDLTQPLSRMLAGQATVHDVSDTFGADFEVFMRVGASPQSVQSIRRALQSDPAVESVRYISPDDALAVFRREFASEPALIEGTQAADLPSSFRVIVRAGQPKPAVANRYSGRTGVDTVISSEFPQAVATSLAMQMPGARVAALGGVDAEIFLRVGASDAEIQGVKSALERDSEVKSFRMLDQQEAFAIFAEEFSDQPAIVQQTKPSDLPVSFRVKARRGTLSSAFESKYRALAGVDTVIEPGSPPKPTKSACP